MLAASRASSVIMNQGRITAYQPSLISDFNRIGLSMRLGVRRLQVARLNNSYIADTQHLFSEVRNIVMKRTIPTTLRVTVRGANGSFIRETMIWLDNDAIELKMKVDFFAVCYGGWPRSNSISLPFANRIYRPSFLKDAKYVALI